MQNKKITIGPIALTTTYTTNILNPPTATGGVNGGSSAQVIYIHQIRITNKTTLAQTYRLFKGATGANAAGTELAIDKVVPANDWVDVHYSSPHRLDAADFLVGGASLTLSLLITIFAEIGVAG